MTLARTSLAALLAAALALPATASAATPIANGKYTVHDHATKGKNWHVQLEVNGKSTRIKAMVLYVEECDKADGFAMGIPVDADGRFEVTKTLKDGGTWRIRASFIAPNKVSGVYEMTKGDCATGERPFEAMPPTSAGHAGHGSHFTFGTPAGSYADLGAATPSQRAGADRLRAKTLARSKHYPFDTYRHARERFQVTARGPRPRPLIFHTHRSSYNNDGRNFDPNYPESLVWWWPAQGDPILVAFMYRSENMKPVKTFGTIFGWHQHSRTSPPMTHVWLTQDLRSAAANCMPRRELTFSIARYEWSPPMKGSGAESQPCGASDGHTDHTHP